MNFLSRRLTTKARKLLELHCSKKGLSFQIFTGNRLFVQGLEEKQYCALMRLEIYSLEK